MIPRGQNWTEKRLLLDAQMAWAAYLVVRRLTRVDTSAYVFAAETPKLTGVFGAAFRFAAHARLERGGLAEVARLKKSARSDFKASTAAQLDRVLTRTMRHLQAHGIRPLCWLPKTPGHILHGTRGRAWQGEKTQRVRRHQHRQLLDELEAGHRPV